MADLIGQSLGRYHILAQLGEGGMAIIYKAYDTRLERDVAIKIIRKGAFPPDHVERILKRFEREAKALARLSHPNIVKVHDYGEHEGSPYLVMEYLPSGTLKQRMEKPIPWQEAIQILLPIAEALDYAHSQNMVHRDVKPSNILLTQRGQPMLTDFGIAKVLDLEETQELTGTSAAVGTPEYMAPEQATARTVDHRADIYALGVVLYEMVTGRKPFIADTPMAVLIKHATESLPRPKHLVPNLPDSVEKMLLKALAKNPVDRYQSMAEMGNAFEKIMSGQAKSLVVREKAKRQPDQTNIRKRTLVESASAIKSIPPKAMSFLKVGGIIGIILMLFWAGSWAMPKFLSLIPTPKPSATVTSTATAIPPTKTLVPTPTKTKVPTSAPTRTPTPVPLSSILLHEDFEDGTADGWIFPAGTWTIEKDATGNHYWVGTGPTDYPQIWYGEAKIGWTDYAFESRIKFVTGGTLFICIRSDTGSAFYTVYTNGSYIDLSQYNPSKNVEWKSFELGRSLSLQQNKWYTIRLEVQGSSLTAYVDNELVLSKVLPTPLVNTQGGVGYYMGGNEKFYFDDIKIWSLR